MVSGQAFMTYLVDTSDKGIITVFAKLLQPATASLLCQAYQKLKLNSRPTNSQ